MPRIVTVVEQAEFLYSLKRDEEGYRRISEMKQGSKEWLASRVGRMTGSIMGSALGHMFFKPKSELLLDLVWPERPRSEEECIRRDTAMAWGSNHEDVACGAFEAIDGMKVQHCGLRVHPRFWWLAYSPDGWFLDNKGRRILLEIKCPFKKKLYPSIPVYYADQIYLGMSLFRCSYANFVVWTPDKVSIERFPANPDYVKYFMFPKINQFYFREVLPLLVAKEKGMLRMGEVSMPPGTCVEEFWPASLMMDATLPEPISLAFPSSASSASSSSSSPSSSSTPASPPKPKRRKPTAADRSRAKASGVPVRLNPLPDASPEEKTVKAPPKTKKTKKKRTIQRSIRSLMVHDGDGVRYELEPPKKRRAARKVKEPFNFARASFHPRYIPQDELPPEERTEKYWFKLKPPRVKRRVYNIIQPSVSHPLAAPCSDE